MAADDDFNGARVHPFGIVPHKRNGLYSPHPLNDLFGDQFQSQMLVHYSFARMKRGGARIGQVLNFVVSLFFVR